MLHKLGYFIGASGIVLQYFLGLSLFPLSWVLLLLTIGYLFYYWGCGIQVYTPERLIYTKYRKVLYDYEPLDYWVKVSKRRKIFQISIKETTFAYFATLPSFIRVLFPSTKHLLPFEEIATVHLSKRQVTLTSQGGAVQSLKNIWEIYLKKRNGTEQRIAESNDEFFIRKLARYIAVLSEKDLIDELAIPPLRFSAIELVTPYFQKIRERNVSATHRLREQRLDLYIRLLQTKNIFFKFLYLSFALLTFWAYLHFSETLLSIFQLDQAWEYAFDFGRLLLLFFLLYVIPYWVPLRVSFFVTVHGILYFEQMPLFPKQVYFSKEDLYEVYVCQIREDFKYSKLFLVTEHRTFTLTTFSAPLLTFKKNLDTAIKSVLAFYFPYEISLDPSVEEKTLAQTTIALPASTPTREPAFIRFADRPKKTFTPESSNPPSQKQQTSSFSSDRSSPSQKTEKTNLDLQSKPTDNELPVEKSPPQTPLAHKELNDLQSSLTENDLPLVSEEEPSSQKPVELEHIEPDIQSLVTENDLPLVLEEDPPSLSKEKKFDPQSKVTENDLPLLQEIPSLPEETDENLDSSPPVDFFESNLFSLKNSQMNEASPLDTQMENLLQENKEEQSKTVLIFEDPEITSSSKMVEALHEGEEENLEEQGGESQELQPLFQGEEENEPLMAIDIPSQSDFPAFEEDAFFGTKSNRETSLEYQAEYQAEPRQDTEPLLPELDIPSQSDFPAFEDAEEAPAPLEKQEDPAEKALREGLEFVEKKQVIRALNSFNEAVQANPQLLEAHYHLGLIHIQLFEYNEGIQNLSRALQGNPEYLPALEARATAYITIGDIQKGRDDYVRIAKLDPTRKAEIVKKVRELDKKVK